MTTGPKITYRQYGGKASIAWTLLNPPTETPPPAQESAKLTANATAVIQHGAYGYGCLQIWMPFGDSETEPDRASVLRFLVQAAEAALPVLRAMVAATED